MPNINWLVYKNMRHRKVWDRKDQKVIWRELPITGVHYKGEGTPRKLVALTQSQFPRYFMRLELKNVELKWAAQTEETATGLQRNSWKTKKLNSHGTEKAVLLTVAFQRSFLVSAVLMCLCDSFVSLDGRESL
jgi:hypothetical protein